MRFNKYYNPELFNTTELKHINHLISIFNDMLVAGCVTEEEAEFTLIKKLIKRFGTEKAFEIYTNI